MINNFFGKKGKKTSKRGKKTISNRSRSNPNQQTNAPQTDEGEYPAVLGKIGKTIGGATAGAAMIPLGTSVAGIATAGLLGKLMQTMATGLLKAMVSKQPRVAKANIQPPPNVAGAQSEIVAARLDDLITIQAHALRTLRAISITVNSIGRRLKTDQQWKAEMTKNERLGLARIASEADRRRAEQNARTQQPAAQVAKAGVQDPFSTFGWGMHAATIVAITKQLNDAAQDFIKTFVNSITVFGRTIATAFTANGLIGRAFASLRSLPIITKVFDMFAKVGEWLKPFEPAIEKMLRIGGLIMRKLFLPITALMALADTVEGAIKGYDKGGLIGSILGGVGGLFNSLIGSLLDVLKDGASWFAMWLGLDDVAKWLDSFDVTEKLRGTIFDVAWWEDVWDRVASFAKTISGWVGNLLGKIDDKLGIGKSRQQVIDQKRITEGAARAVTSKPAPTSSSLYNETVKQLESSGNANARASTTTATGHHQFVEGTWMEMMSKYGKLYGYDKMSRDDQLRLRTDPVASERMLQHFTNENKAYLDKTFGRSVSNADLYKAHFLGMGGAKQLLEAVAKNPNAIAANMMSEAAKANRSIFYDGSRARTVKEVNDLIEMKYRAMETKVASSRPNVLPQTGRNTQFASIINDAELNRRVAQRGGGTNVVAPQTTNRVSSTTVVNNNPRQPYLNDSSTNRFTSTVRYAG